MHVHCTEQKALLEMSRSVLFQPSGWYRIIEGVISLSSDDLAGNCIMGGYRGLQLFGPANPIVPCSFCVFLQDTSENSHSTSVYNRC